MFYMTQCASYATHLCVQLDSYTNVQYGVSTISRLLKIIRLFCKKAL